MATTQFVHETPDQEQYRKKRLRIVHSCDNCRSRKVKCVRPTSEGACDACIEAKMQCHFHDKERYHAEKGPSPGRGSHAPSQSSKLSPRDSSLYGVGRQSDSASPTVSPTHTEGTSHGMSHVAAGLAAESPGDPYSTMQYGHAYATPPIYAYPAYSSAAPSYVPESQHQYTSASGQGTQFGMTGAGAVQAAPPPQPTYTPLFESQHPHSALMPSLLHAFFSYLGPSHAFLLYEDVAQRFFNRTLEPALASVLAGMAVRYEPRVPQVTGRDKGSITKAYIENAKALIIKKSTGTPSLSILYATILVAWTEASGNTLVNDFQTYATHALRIAKSLGLHHDATLAQRAGGDPAQAARLRAAWESITQMFPVGATPA